MVWRGERLARFRHLGWKFPVSQRLHHKRLSAATQKLTDTAKLSSWRWFTRVWPKSTARSSSSESGSGLCSAECACACAHQQTPASHTATLAAPRLDQELRFSWRATAWVAVHIADALPFSNQFYILEVTNTHLLGTQNASQATQFLQRNASFLHGQEYFALGLGVKMSPFTEILTLDEMIRKGSTDSTWRLNDKTNDEKKP